MINSIVYNNVDGVNSIGLNTEIYPMHVFEPSVDQRTSTERTKSQQDGVYPTKTQRGGMELHTEGMILADSSADYFDKRQALLLALFGVPAVVVTDRKTGTLVIEFEGSTEDWVSDVTITMFSAPIKGLYPGSGEYAITFFSYSPWMEGVDTSIKYWVV